jgi:RNA polymerase sigma-70 factor (ECF subfamily)
VEDVSYASVGKAKTSDDDLERIYLERYHRLLRVPEAIVGDPDLAHDAVQESFARALRGRWSYRGEGPLEGWIWRTVVNTSLNARRDRPPPAAELEPEAHAHANGDAPDGAVRALVAALPERQRLVLFLRYYADLDYAAIAQALAISPGTVGATLHAARQTLRGALEEVRA